MQLTVRYFCLSDLTLYTRQLVTGSPFVVNRNSHLINADDSLGFVNLYSPLAFVKYSATVSFKLTETAGSSCPVLSLITPEISFGSALGFALALSAVIYLIEGIAALLP